MRVCGNKTLPARVTVTCGKITKSTSAVPFFDSLSETCPYQLLTNCYILANLFRYIVLILLQPAPNQGFQGGTLRFSVGRGGGVRLMGWNMHSEGGGPRVGSWGGMHVPDKGDAVGGECRSVF